MANRSVAGVWKTRRLDKPKIEKYLKASKLGSLDMVGNRMGVVSDLLLTTYYLLLTNLLTY